MSNVPNFNPTNTTTAATRPEHHMHRPDDRLPGAAGGQPTVDYSAPTMENTNTQTLPGAYGRGGAMGQDAIGQYDNTTSTAPMPVGERQGRAGYGGAPATVAGGPYEGQGIGHGQGQLHGGPGITGRHGQPAPAGTTGTAGIGDKVLGKTEKVVGKMTNSAGMVQKGEQRELFGKGTGTGPTSGGAGGTY